MNGAYLNEFALLYVYCDLNINFESVIDEFSRTVKVVGKISIKLNFDIQHH